MTNTHTSPHEEEVLTWLNQITQKLLRNQELYHQKPMGIFDPSLMHHTLTEFCKNANEKINTNKNTWDLWVNKIKNEQDEVINDFFKRQYQSNSSSNQDQSGEEIFQLIYELYSFNKESILKTIDEWSATKDNRRKMRYFVKLMMDASSPINHPFMNPEILNATIQEKGENLARGFSKLSKNLENSEDLIFSSHLHKHNFKLGKNLATTKGFVVYQNRFCQLIHYTPTQQETYKTPLLIVPSWINKYYIFDLSPQNSMIRWCLDQGQDVFIISWVNPDETYKDASIDEYILEGLLDSIIWVKKSLSISSVNLMGYCVGGTIVLLLMAYLNKINQAQSIKSATLIATPIDFSHLDELATFVCDQQLKNLEEHALTHGIIDGRYMRFLFSSLRAQDLIWPSVVNNYFLGKEEEIIDFIFWNYDHINLPGRLHLQYLQEIFHKNSLIKPHAITLGGETLDISSIDQPIYMIGFEKDHIVPWRSAWEGLKFLPHAQFVLGGAGHVAGNINPPSNNKYNYKTSLPSIESHEQWLQQSITHDGSWWVHWFDWVKAHSGTLQKGREIPNQYILEAAPGKFAQMTA